MAWWKILLIVLGSMGLGALILYVAGAIWLFNNWRQ